MARNSGFERFLDSVCHHAHWRACARGVTVHDVTLCRGDRDTFYWICSAEATPMTAILAILCLESRDTPARMNYAGKACILRAKSANSVNARSERVNVCATACGGTQAPAQTHRGTVSSTCMSHMHRRRGCSSRQSHDVGSRRISLFRNSMNAEQMASRMRPRRMRAAAAVVTRCLNANYNLLYRHSNGFHLQDHFFKEVFTSSSCMTSWRGTFSLGYHFYKSWPDNNFDLLFSYNKMTKFILFIAHVTSKWN